MCFFAALLYACSFAWASMSYVSKTREVAKRDPAIAFHREIEKIIASRSEGLMTRTTTELVTPLLG